MNKSTPPAASTVQRVGSYRLLNRIGEGGMGVVHLAQHADGRRVALKVLRPHIIGDDEARERLSREVASLRRVVSPRVAEVLDADPWGETPFVATRYVPGLSLQQHVRTHGPLRGEDLRWFAAGLVEAVIAVHRVGVLHRDIKPSNVLLEGRSPVLIDFGLARLAEDPRLTHTGWLLGTPGYLAPEILYGDDATTASDVHSWAATVVFAATGEPPFGTGPAMAIMDRVRRGEHRLSAVPADLRPLVEACLAPEPHQRPTTTEVLATLGTRPSPVEDDFTMPFVIGAVHDDDPTDVLANAASTAVLRQQPPAPDPAATPWVQPGQPEMMPWRRPPSGLARFQRGCLLFGLFALVSTGFALAPYVALMLIALAALAVRTVSWTTESARERRWRRGRTRWYDGPLAAATTPWYLVVATGGTLVLMVWAATVAFLVGLVTLLFRPPMTPGLLLVGAVLAGALWWGPGSRRLRVPVRALASGSTRAPWAGWTGIVVLGVAVGLVGYALATTGVSWQPWPGPPWRDGTLLGDLVHYL